MDSEITPPSTADLAFKQLPFEILSQIALYLLPTRQPCLYPASDARQLPQHAEDEDKDENKGKCKGKDRDRGEDKEKGKDGFKYSYKDLLAFAYLTKSTYAATLPLLYYAPRIMNSADANKLYESLSRPDRPDTSQPAALPRGYLELDRADKDGLVSVRLPSFDKCHKWEQRKPGQTVLHRDQRVHYPRHLFMASQYWRSHGRNIIINLDRLKSLTVGVIPSVDGPTYGLPFDARCRPRRVTIANQNWNEDHDYSEGPYHAILRKTTHLHTIHVTPYDIEHLTGAKAQAPYDAEQDYWYFRRGRPPPRPSYIPLSHVRLSKLLPGTLAVPPENESSGSFYYNGTRREHINFRNFILERIEATVYKKQGRPVPRAELFKNSFIGHQTIYKLAVASARFPKFRRMLIEVPDDVPREAEPDVPRNGFGTRDDYGRVIHAPPFGRDIPTDAYWARVKDAKKWIQALIDECRSPQHRKDNLGEARIRARILEDMAAPNGWRHPRDLDEHFEKLLASGDEAGKDGEDIDKDLPEEWPRAEVRIVAQRPGGWNSEELLQDFQAQVRACDRRTLEINTGAAFKLAKAKAEREGRRSGEVGKGKGKKKAKKTRNAKKTKKAKCDGDGDGAVQHADGDDNGAAEHADAAGSTASITSVSLSTAPASPSSSDASDSDSSSESSDPADAPPSDEDSEREADDDVISDGTCFSDPCIFDLARTRPYLAYAPITGTDSQRQRRRAAERRIYAAHRVFLQEGEEPDAMEAGRAKEASEEELTPFARRVREDPPHWLEWRDPSKFFYTGLLPRLERDEEVEWEWEGEEVQPEGEQGV